MPTPKDGESQDEFHSRCMSKLVGDEGYDSDQANAICYKYWENKNENKGIRDMRTIRIKQETPIPGTDYVLEAGDKIQAVIEEDYDYARPIIKQINEMLMDITGGGYKAGEVFARVMFENIVTGKGSDFMKGLMNELQDIHR